MQLSLQLLLHLLKLLLLDILNILISIVQQSHRILNHQLLNRILISLLLLGKAFILYTTLIRKRSL